jgi:hypothetical protein
MNPFAPPCVVLKRNLEEPNAVTRLRFRVQPRHLSGHGARIVEEPSFEAAAIAYVEADPCADADGEVTLIVRDLGSGHEHCIRLDLQTGEARPCE